MGLAVSVGTLADLNKNDEEGAEWIRQSLKQVNQVLRENNLSTHVEPEELPNLPNRSEMDGYPYSFLHHLRRFAAHAKVNPKWIPKPFPKKDDPTEDPVLIDEYAMLDSHLLCHSDCEGFYVPVDFKDPIFADEELIPGGMLGSSQGLMRELVGIAPKLGIKLEGSSISDKEAVRINELVRNEGRFWIELCVWLSLFEAARLSVEYQTAIDFG